MRNDFAIFILTHGRPDSIYTLNTLEKANYSGKYYIIIDDEDDSADKYFKKYGDKVIQFNKEKYNKIIDNADNFNDKRAIIYARVACFDIAKELGLNYFLELDDDYTRFSYRFNKYGEFKWEDEIYLNKIINHMIEYLESSGASTIAFAQCGDFIGGEQGDMGNAIKIKRKAMNTFFLKTDRRFKFLGRLNEDVSTYVRLGQLGKLFITINTIAINQKQTQQIKGGMSEHYKESGTYVKSFYTILFSPSSVKIALMGNKAMRLHHKINWRYTVPKILDESLKKGK